MAGQTTCYGHDTVVSQVVVFRLALDLSSITSSTVFRVKYETSRVATIYHPNPNTVCCFGRRLCAKQREVGFLEIYDRDFAWKTHFVRNVGNFPIKDELLSRSSTLAGCIVIINIVDGFICARVVIMRTGKYRTGRSGVRPPL